MPPRWLSVAIVAFWLCTTGWLLYRDVWPWLLPGQAPPFTIDLEDEVQTQQAHVHWTVSYNDHPFLRAETWVAPNPKDDTFDLHAQVRQPAVPFDGARGGDPFGGLIAIRDMSSVYTVTRQGDLRAVSMRFSGDAHVGPFLTLPGQGTLTGEVRDGRFYSHLRASTPLFGGKDIDTDLKPVAVTAHGSVLSPLHPVNRIAGLRPGQTWRMPLVDPVKDAFAALVRDALPADLPGLGDENREIVLTASVRPKPETLTWNGKPAECLVIDCRGDDVTAATWVQVGDGKVLRQESERGGEKVAMQRD